MNDPAYVDHYDASHHEHWIKALKERDEPTPFLPKSTAMPNERIG